MAPSQPKKPSTSSQNKDGTEDIATQENKSSSMYDERPRFNEDGVIVNFPPPDGDMSSRWVALCVEKLAPDERHWRWPAVFAQSGLLLAQWVDKGSPALMIGEHGLRYYKVVSGNRQLVGTDKDKVRICIEEDIMFATSVIMRGDLYLEDRILERPSGSDTTYTSPMSEPAPSEIKRSARNVKTTGMSTGETIDIDKLTRKHKKVEPAGLFMDKESAETKELLLFAKQQLQTYIATTQKLMEGVREYTDDMQQLMNEIKPGHIVKFSVVQDALDKLSTIYDETLDDIRTFQSEQQAQKKNFDAAKEDPPVSHAIGNNKRDRLVESHKNAASETLSPQPMAKRAKMTHYAISEGELKREKKFRDNEYRWIG